MITILLLEESYVGSSHIEIVGVTTVTGIFGGKLPSSDTNVNDFKVLTTPLDPSTDNSLFTRLPKDKVESVNLTDSILTIRKTFNVNIAVINYPVQLLLMIMKSSCHLSSRYSLIREMELRGTDCW